MTTEEAIHILDPETAVEALAEIEYYGGFNGDKAKVSAINEACRLAVIALRAQQDRENTNPLTLDELREMRGKPVWVCPAKQNGKIPSRWMLLADFRSEYGVFLFASASGIAQGYDTGSYGKTWLAYRHKPKERTNEAYL